MVSIICFYEGEVDPYETILKDIKLIYPNVLVFKIQDNPTLSQLYDIKIKPTMIFFSGLIEHDRCEGVIPRDDIFTILRGLVEEHHCWGDDEDE